MRMPRRALHPVLLAVFLFILATSPGWPQTPTSQSGTKQTGTKGHATEAVPSGASVSGRKSPEHPPGAKPETAAKSGSKPAARNGENKPAPPAQTAAKPTAQTSTKPPTNPKHAKPAGKAAAKPPAGAGAKAPAEAASKPPAPPPAAEPGPPKGTATGLPLPRFAALRSDEVNFRTGPGTRYPIDWVYKRRDLPVEIEREFEVWRLVADPEGVKGWVHQATLTGRRSLVVVGAERSVREKPEDGSPAVARVKPGVIGHILHCDAGSDWCRVQVNEYRGWLKRQEFWGSLQGEAIN